MTGGVGVEHRAQYAFRGLQHELARTLPLTQGETVVFEGAMTNFARRGWAVAVYMRLTRTRLCLVEHRLIRPDRVFEVPPDAVSGIDVDRRQRLCLAMSLEHGARHYRLGRSRLLVTPALTDPVPVVAESLARWIAGAT